MKKNKNVVLNEFYRLMSILKIDMSYITKKTNENYSGQTFQISATRHATIQFVQC